MLFAAAAVRPERVDLLRDSLAEVVARIRERKADVRVQALEAARAAALAADAELERGAAVGARRAGGEPGSDPPLFLVRALTACLQQIVTSNCVAPALDPAGRLEAGDLRDEMAAGDVVGRRERLAVRVVGALLRDRGPAERAADGHAPESARRAADLSGYDGAFVVHADQATCNKLDFSADQAEDRLGGGSVCGIWSPLPLGLETSCSGNAGRKASPRMLLPRPAALLLPPRSERPLRALPPVVDPLDDEEVLAGPHVPERARLARERRERGRRAEPALELLLLQLELLHGRAALRQLALRIDVCLQRPVVEQGDERENADGEPAADEDGAAEPAGRHDMTFA